METLASGACGAELRANFVEQMRAVPGAIALICVSDGTTRTGLAATAWNSLCADPPMLLACVNRQASAHSLILAKRTFSVNLLSTLDIETVRIFSAQTKLTGEDRFLAGEWDSGPSGQPLRKRAVVAFECELDACHSYGTHDILIGKVCHMQGGEAAPPLLYLNGGFCAPTALR